MIDQIIIGDKASFDDFGASVAKRARKQPPKKSIKETVPFSNVTYDFTKINGEIYWEEGEHEYVLEMTAPTAEKLEEMKTALSGWLMNIIQEELHDPLIPDYHFIVTYEDMSFEDDDGMDKTTATVVFSSYPYKIANYPKVYEHINLNPREEKNLLILNESSHRIRATFDITAMLFGGKCKAEITNNGMTRTYLFEKSGTWEIELGEGLNEVLIQSIYEPDAMMTSNCFFTISFYEEVF